MRLWNPFGLRELNALWKDPVFRGRGVPRGDGRSVLLVPGFLSGDWSLRLVHGWLDRIGYRSYLSGIYVNAFHSEHMLAGLRHRMAEILKDDDAPITLIGHSRGGLLAKVLSQRRPKDVEQVITLGSPLADVTDLALMTRAAVGVVTTANELGFGQAPPRRGTLRARPQVAAGGADDFDLHAFRRRGELSQLHPA